MIASFSHAGISGNSGLSKKKKRIYITEKICDGLHGQCRSVTYPVVPPEEMGNEPYYFNYDRTSDEPCLSYYIYKGGS